MHVADGILPLTIAASSFAGTAAIVGTSLRWVAPANVPRVALLTAAFFVASLIHVPVGLVSVHLLLHGLAGIILGPLSPIAILVALALQSILLLEGGLSALGFNTLSMTFGAMVARAIFDVLRGDQNPQRAAAAGFLAGSVAVIASAMIVVLALWLTGDDWTLLRRTVLIAHLPMAAIEGLVAASASAFIVRVKPDLLRTTWSRRGVCSLHSTVVP